jgi:DnaJ-class molecular chaperone
MLEAARYGSYFRCLDLPLTAATSEVREAYRARRAQADAFRPLAARSPQVAEALDVVAGVLEDALEVLADPDRRLAYRRAVEAP